MAEQSVPPLTYPQVRMLAEAALGLDNTSAVYTFGPANAFGPQMLLAGSPPTPAVVVPAANKTKFTRFSAVEMQVTPAGGGTLSLNAAGYNVDAMFWSDAAVQKFVLPYYASCMGFFAPERLTSLQAAWNGTAEGTQVVALMHVTGAPVGQAGNPVPVEPLWVVYVQNNVLQTTPLSVFPTSGAAVEAPPLSPAGSYFPPDLSTVGAYPEYIALRAMAEWSASLSAEPMYFSYDAAQGTFGTPSTDAGDGSTITVPVYNPLAPLDRLPPSQVTLEMTGNPSIDLLGQGPGADAIFWSTGAIEQFMLPYYASTDGFEGLLDLAAIVIAWDDPEVVGLVHIPRSVWVTEEMQFTLTTAAAAEIHLVRSDGSRVPASRVIAEKRRAG